MARDILRPILTFKSKEIGLILKIYGKSTKISLRKIWKNGVGISNNIKKIMCGRKPIRRASDRIKIPENCRIGRRH